MRTPSAAALLTLARAALAALTALGALGALGATGGARPLDAQAVNPAPAAAKAFVVRVVPHFAGVAEQQLGGAGIVVGVDAQAVWIATARHVVVAGAPADSVWVTVFGGADSVRATVLPHERERYDLAVLRVPRSALPGWQPAGMDRLGDVRELGFGAAVSPMGCPQGVCWGVPVPPDRVVGVDRAGIIFQSAVVSGGNSGGALFNEWWEVVGLVTEYEPPRANALAMDEVLAQLRQWGVPVTLVRPTVPRGGYRTTVALSLLLPVGHAESPFATERRLPSGRLTASWRGRSLLTWQLSALRLAPDNLAVTAGLAGLGLTLHRGRFAARPFVEAGLGRVVARHNVGEDDLPNTVIVDGREVPLWTRVEADGLGVGLGLDVQVVVLPHVALGVTAGRWSFGLPEDAPPLPSVFVGGGLRWAR